MRIGVAFSGGLAPSEAVDVASLIPGAVAKTAAARDALRPAVGLYAGFCPGCNWLQAEAGFCDVVHEINDAFDRGGRDAAATVPDELGDAIALAATPETCGARIDEYRRAGLLLPIVSPRVSGDDGLAMAMATIRACTP